MYVKFKIKKCTNYRWWYNHLVGESIQIDLDTVEIKNEIHENLKYTVVVWYDKVTDLYYSIRAEDIGYFNYIRKQKMKKLYAKNR